MSEVSKAAFAREAGVSTTTLTRYLAGESVAPETTKAIEKAAATLGIDVTTTNTGEPAHPELERPPMDEPTPALPPEAEVDTPKPSKFDPSDKPKSGLLEGNRTFAVLTIEETGKPRVGTNHEYTLLIETLTKAGTQQKRIALDSEPTFAEILKHAE